MIAMLRRWIRAWRALPPITADLLLTAALTALSLGELVGPSDRPHGSVAWPAVALTLAATLPLVARRRHPMVVCAVAAVAEALFLVAGPLTSPGPGLGLAVALYTLASRTERRVSLRIASLSALVYTLVLLTSVAGGRAGSVISLFSATAVVAGSWSAGENVRTRRAYLAQLEERARRLEAEREESAMRAARDERARIARELHDVVAHHVSVIAVQAGVAAAIAERQPERAREAQTFAFIQETSRQALAEMRALLTVLRGDEEGGAEGGAERAPQPSLAQVAQLVGQSRAAGLPVTLEVEGAARPLPAALDLSAYRIVQEALTNSLKHAGRAQARVLVRYAPDALELEIVDSGPGMAPRGRVDGAGRGLIGMRERVALFGGALDVGPAPEHGFRVRARLPLGDTAR